MIVDIALSISGKSDEIKSNFYANGASVRGNSVKEMNMSYYQYTGDAHLFGIAESSDNDSTNSNMSAKGLMKRLSSFQSIQLNEKKDIEYKITYLADTLEAMNVRGNQQSDLAFSTLIFEKNKLGMVSGGNGVYAYRFRDGLITELNDVMGHAGVEEYESESEEELVDKIYKTKIDDNMELELNTYDVLTDDIYVLCNDAANNTISERIKFIFEEEKDVAYILKALKELSNNVDSEVAFLVIRIVEAEEIQETVEEFASKVFADEDEDEKFIKEITGDIDDSPLDPSLIDLLNKKEVTKESLEQKLKKYDKPKKFDFLKTLTWALFIIAIVLVAYLFVFNPFASDKQVMPTPTPNAVPTVEADVTPVPDGKVTEVTPTPTKAAATNEKTYTVKEGDTLGGISYKFYGTTADYKKIMEANGIEDENSISIGQKLKIPE